ncbi:MAG: hypothetical protein AAGF12_08295 [Myxococcota bacterium]
MRILRFVLITSVVTVGCGDDVPSPSDPIADATVDRSSCTPTAESCDGLDNDCDSAIDEGEADDLGCGAGRCEGGRCTCPSDQMCGSQCVDLATNPEHCGRCGRRCEDQLSCRTATCCAPDGGKMDLLFVVDNSDTMEEEQTLLAQQVPVMIETLVTGDTNRDGTPEFTGVTDLQVGIVSTDMGNLGNMVPGCLVDTGDDGILSMRGGANDCMATYPKVVSYRGSVPALSMEVACKAQLGNRGCGFEQPLEAALKALMPSTGRLRFFQDSTGHGDGENQGFLREDSILGVVFITDEDDCSARDPDLFDEDSDTYRTAFGLRCYLEPTGLHPLGRFMNAILDLRSPEDLFVAVVGGVPRELVVDTPNFTTILMDDRMAIEVDASAPQGIRSACRTPAGSAVPSRRLIQTLADLENRDVPVALTSICDADYPGLLRPLIPRLRQVPACP